MRQTGHIAGVGWLTGGAGMHALQIPQMSFDPNALILGQRYSRVELAAKWGYASFEAISKGVVTPAGSPYIILFVTREKQQSLTQYKDFVSGNYLHWEGEKAHANDQRIAHPEKFNKEIHLFYRDIHHSPFRFYGRVSPIRFVERKDKPSEFVFRLVHDLGATDDLSQHQHELAEIPETTREAIIQARVGQGLFRDRLLELWGGCAVTGINVPDLLRASHIKPWRISSNVERLDPHNGLMLLPQYDLLFDRGYITFHETGELRVSPAIADVPEGGLGIDLKAKLRFILPEHVPFLKYHRTNEFISRTALA